MNRITNRIRILQSLLIIGGLMIVGLFIATSIIQLFFHGDLTRESVLWGSIAQNFLAFILPTLSLPLFIGWKERRWINFEATGRPMIYLWICVMLIVSLPFMSTVINFNEAIHLPEGLSELESTLRSMEEKGSASSALLLNNLTFTQMLISILVVGVLTGIGEEVFFRGGVQNIFLRFGVKPGWSIFIAAVIFSALHFQFFGFIPRLLLGIWFGWLYWKSRSIWTSITAHALNNSLVVVSTWAISKGWLPQEFEMFGTSGWVSVALVYVSLLSIGFIIFRIKNHSTKNYKVDNSIEYQ